MDLRTRILEYLRTHNTIVGGVVEDSMQWVIANQDARNITSQMIREEVNRLIDDGILAENERGRLIVTELGFNVIHGRQ